MKKSLKREQILNLFKSGNLFTANEICELLPEVDRATIYRNIHRFVESGVLREVNLKKGISSYELNIKGDYHQHFICTDCEKVIPVEIDNQIIEQIAPSGVKFEDFELNLKGKCTDCK